MLACLTLRDIIALAFAAHCSIRHATRFMLPAVIKALMHISLSICDVLNLLLPAQVIGIVCEDFWASACNKFGMDLLFCNHSMDLFCRIGLQMEEGGRKVETMSSTASSA